MKRKKYILFVCWGGIIRSVTAEKYLKKLLEKRGILKDFSVHSASIQGSGNTPPTEHPRIQDYKDAWADLKKPTEAYKIDINDNVSTPITLKMIKEADVVFAMDRKVLEEYNDSLYNQFPRFKKKMHVFTELDGNDEGIQDPYFMDSKHARANAIDEIVRIVSENADKIIEWTT